MDGASAGLPNGGNDSGVLSPFKKLLVFIGISEVFPTFTKDRRITEKIQTRFTHWRCVTFLKDVNSDTCRFLFDNNDVCEAIFWYSFNVTLLALFWQNFAELVEWKVFIVVPLPQQSLLQQQHSCTWGKFIVLFLCCSSTTTNVLCEKQKKCLFGWTSIEVHYISHSFRQRKAPKLVRRQNCCWGNWRLSENRRCNGILVRVMACRPPLIFIGLCLNDMYSCIGLLKHSENIKEKLLLIVVFYYNNNAYNYCISYF